MPLILLNCLSALEESGQTLKITVYVIYSFYSFVSEALSDLTVVILSDPFVPCVFTDGRRYSCILTVVLKGAIQINVFIIMNQNPCLATRMDHCTELMLIWLETRPEEE